jgi:hypothetical protein
MAYFGDCRKTSQSALFIFSGFSPEILIMLFDTSGAGFGQACIDQKLLKKRWQER